jgi:hypothetical protein
MAQMIHSGALKNLEEARQCVRASFGIKTYEQEEN